MYDLGNIKEIDQVGRFLSRINKFFGVKLEKSDLNYLLHDIFKLKQTIFTINGARIPYYERKSVENILNNGSLGNAIRQHVANKNVTQMLSQQDKPQHTYSSPTSNYNNIRKRNGRYVIIQPKVERDPEDNDAYYKNGENNMDEYSEYLINHVYQNESYIRSIVRETLRKYL